MSEDTPQVIKSDDVDASAWRRISEMIKGGLNKIFRKSKETSKPWQRKVLSARETYRAENRPWAKRGRRSVGAFCNHHSALGVDQRAKERATKEWRRKNGEFV